MKRFILNADDLGMSSEVNRAVSECVESELLGSVSLCANGDFFDDAVKNILPKYKNLGVGVHLNIINGKSLCTDLETLTDSDMNFNNTYLKILINSFNPKNPKFFEEVEREFRRQIEKVMSVAKVTHIDSHSHLHSIPPIFDLTCRLAKEYGIKEVRTHFEKFYIVPEVFRHLNKKYLLNASKKFLLNLLTVINESTVHKYGLKTNDYLIGISYADCMDSRAVYYGLLALKYDNITVETIIHPSRYEEGTINNRFDEYMITKNVKLKNRIKKMGYEITNYVEKEN